MHEIQAKSILSPRGGINVYRGCTAWVHLL